MHIQVRSVQLLLGLGGMFFASFHPSFFTVYAQGAALQEVDRFLHFFESFLPFFRALIGVCAVLIFFFFFWGLTDYVRKNDASLEIAKTRMLWSLMGVFVLVSVWGLIYLLQNVLLGGSYDESDIQLIGPRSALYVVPPRTQALT